MTTKICDCNQGRLACSCKDDTEAAELQSWLVGNARTVRPVDHSGLMGWALAALRNQAEHLINASSSVERIRTDVAVADCNDAERREAALREELADRNAVIDLKHRDLIEAQTAVTGWAAKCKAAEQRNACYESLLRQIIPCLAMSTNSKAPTYIRQINEALPKPTESGASAKCKSDGGTCGLGGHCGECPYTESGAGE